MEPRYQELRSEDVPRAEEDGVSVRVIAGEALGARSPVFTRTPTMYLDFTLAQGARLHQPVPYHWNAFVFVIDGEGVFGAGGSLPASAHHTLVLGPGDGVIAWNNSRPSSEGTALRFVLVAGEPLNEPVVQYGPFVMNTQEEVEEAIEDYHLCRNGFENASHWSSAP